MGLFGRLQAIAPAPRMRASSSMDYTTAFFNGDDVPGAWVSSLSAAGVNVTPDLSMTLSAMYCGVTTIAYDLATLPLTVYKYRDDGGKDRVRARSADYMKGGIGDLAYMLRWAPNDFQTATEYIVSQVAQFELRGRAYAEIKDGPGGFLAQLLPRHPDRVTPQRLPTGQLTYKLIEADGSPRYLTSDEMHVVRDLSLDGIGGLSRTQYGSNAIGSALAAERAAGKFFKSGMTASTVATYKGEMEDEDELAMHKSISRYAAGVENSFGLLLVPDDVTIANLGVEPEKAQMMLAREWGAREVARLLRIPPHKLMIAGTQTYASQVQSATDYVVGCLRPIAHTFEQAIQRDLILAKDTYFAEFDLDALLRGDPTARATYNEKAIQNRWMRPSEVRLRENLNPDPDLDRLSEGDNRPGSPAAPSAPSSPAPEDVPADQTDGKTPPPATMQQSRASLKGMLSVHDNAVRVLRRERAGLEKLAKKYQADADGWRLALRTFYDDHTGFVAETMRMSPIVARGYAAQKGSEREAKGIAALLGEHGDAWERYEADELAALALSDGPQTIDDWFARRLTDTRPAAQTTIHVSSPVTIAKDAVAVDARTTFSPNIDARTTVEPAQVDVLVKQPAAPKITVNLPAAAPRTSTKIVERDPVTDGITKITETLE